MPLKIIYRLSSLQRFIPIIIPLPIYSLIYLLHPALSFKHYSVTLFNGSYFILLQADILLDSTKYYIESLISKSKIPPRKGKLSTEVFSINVVFRKLQVILVFLPGHALFSEKFFHSRHGRWRTTSTCEISRF